MKDGALKAMRKKIAAYLSKKQARARGRKAKSLNAKEQFLANKHSLLAVDDTLRCSLGVRGLAAFRPTRPVQRLATTQKRFFLDVSALPARVAQHSPGRLRRACIADVSQKTRL